jgi:hypothetical protein
MAELDSAHLMSELWREKQASKAAKMAAAIARRHSRMAGVPDDLKDVVADAAAIASSLTVKGVLMDESRWYCRDHFDPLSAASAAAAPKSGRRSSGHSSASRSAGGRTPASCSRALCGAAACSSSSFSGSVKVKLEPGVESSPPFYAANSNTKKKKVAHNSSHSMAFDDSDKDEDRFVEGAFLGSRSAYILPFGSGFPVVGRCLDRKPKKVKFGLFPSG